jgi:hypothetical protein
MTSIIPASATNITGPPVAASDDLSVNGLSIVATATASFYTLHDFPPPVEALLNLRNAQRVTLHGGTLPLLTLVLENRSVRRAPLLDRGQ